MRKLFVGLQLAVIFTVLLVVYANKLYPDWSCYPGIDQNWIEKVMKLCEKRECPKSCIFETHGIISFYNYKTLQSVDEIFERLKRLTFSTDENGESSTKIAHNALANCSHLSRDSEDTMCSPELEECIEKATAC